MRRMPARWTKRFDAVLNLFTSFGFFAHPSDDARVINEFARVLKPGGEIILVSRIGAEAGLRRTLEHWFAPAARRLGWRTEFAWGRYVSWAQATPQIRLIERRAMPPLGHFSLIRFGKDAVAEAAASSRTASRA